MPNRYPLTTDSTNIYFNQGSGEQSLVVLGSGGASITDADSNTKIQVEESANENKIRFDTAGSERMIIDDTGKVGIGTSSPNDTLTLESGAISLKSSLSNPSTSSSYIKLFAKDYISSGAYGFDGTVLDTNVWSSYINPNGSVNVNNRLELNLAPGDWNGVWVQAKETTTLNQDHTIEFDVTPGMIDYSSTPGTSFRLVKDGATRGSYYGNPEQCVVFDLRNGNLGAGIRTEGLANASGSSSFAALPTGVSAHVKITISSTNFVRVYFDSIEKGTLQIHANDVAALGNFHFEFGAGSYNGNGTTIFDNFKADHFSLTSAVQPKGLFSLNQSGVIKQLDPWNLTGDDIYYNSGNAGVGVAPTSTRFHIKGSTSDNSAYALKVDNSADTSLLSVRNDGLVSLKNYSLPIVDGTNGQVLVTNGSGTVSFSDQIIGGLGSVCNLRIKNNATNPNYQVDVSADGIVVRDNSNKLKQLFDISFTVNISTSGANGLDTGSEASNTWYYIYAIYNSTASTVAGLLSTSSTSPTMPSGYTYKFLIGAVKNDGSGNFLGFSQIGEEVWYNIRQEESTGLTSTSYATTDISDTIPVASNKIKSVLFGAISTGGDYIFLSTDGVNAKTVFDFSSSNTIGTEHELYYADSASPIFIPIAGNNIYYKIQSGSITLLTRAFKWSHL